MVNFCENAFISIDTITFMFKGVSFNEAFAIIGLKIDDLENFSMDFTFDQNGLGEQFVFNYNGIRVSISSKEIKRWNTETRQIDMLYDVSDKSFFDIQFMSIRFHISGKGLKYLRAKIPDLERKLFYIVANNGVDKVHVTRLDIALDFLSSESRKYQDGRDFLRAMKDYCDNENDFGKRSNIKSSVNSSMGGLALTCYLGSASSDCRLRAYDKFTEQHTELGDWKELPEFYGIAPTDINQWNRIEVQFRNKKAMKFIPETVDFPCVFDNISGYLCWVRDNFTANRSMFHHQWYQYFGRYIENPSLIQLNSHFV